MPVVIETTFEDVAILTKLQEKGVNGEALCEIASALALQRKLEGLQDPVKHLAFDHNCLFAAKLLVSFIEATGPLNDLLANAMTIVEVQFMDLDAARIGNAKSLDQAKSLVARLEGAGPATSSTIQ